jgi:hypothetical protein
VPVYGKSGHTPKIETGNAPFGQFSSRLWRSLADFTFQKVSQNPKSEQYPYNSKVSGVSFLPLKGEKFAGRQLKERGDKRAAVSYMAARDEGGKSVLK